MSWNAADYQSQFSYVWQGGESLLKLLNAQPGERIVDLGCGTGQLAAEIAATGAKVIGLDSDRAMIAQAQSNYPHLSFQVADATSFELDNPADAIFSNAVLHWVTDAEAAANQIATMLESGGRFVAELGGHGNVQTIIRALSEVTNQALQPWYFPTIAEYATLLESVGLEVVYATLFDRPTPLGASGLAGWLEMFGQRFFPQRSSEEWQEITASVEKKAQSLYQNDQWIADYRRIRIVAVKTEMLQV